MSEYILLLSLPLIGLWSLNLGPEHRRGEIVTAATYGLVLLAAEMVVFSIAGIPWSIGALIVLPFLLLLVPIGRRRRGKQQRETPRFRPHPSLLIGLGVSVIFALSVLSALATSFDLLFFWGTKGQKFALARGIDWAFLANPDHRIMHPDYPPLVPLIYAWTALKERILNWNVPLLLTIALFVLSWLAVYLFGREPLGRRRAGFAAGLYAALLMLPALHGALGGNADMALIFFETVALCVLTLSPMDRESRWLAAVALTGVVLTKVEGFPFAALFILAALITVRGGWRERLNAAVQLTILPAIAVITWAALARVHGFVDAYGGTVYSGPKLAPLVDIGHKLLLEASYGVAYLPWLVVVALLLLGSWRAALRHFLIAAGFVAFLLYAYTHMQGDPSLWIGLSANRVLMTPLVTLFFGALAAALHRRADGVAHEHGDRHRPYAPGDRSNP